MAIFILFLQKLVLTQPKKCHLKYFDKLINVMSHSIKITKLLIWTKLQMSRQINIKTVK